MKQRANKAKTCTAFLVLEHLQNSVSGTTCGIHRPTTENKAHPPPSITTPHFFFPPISICSDHTESLWKSRNLNNDALSVRTLPNPLKQSSTTEKKIIIDMNLEKTFVSFLNFCTILGQSSPLTNYLIMFFS